MNSVNIIGRVAADPELRSTTGGTSVCDLRVAIPTPPRNGEDQPPVFVTVRTFGKQADTHAAQLARGHRIAASGRIDYDEWSGPEGEKRSRTYVVADRIDYLAKPNGSRSEEPVPAGVGADDEAPV